MKERGILFSASMVRAILDGRKTQTRRIVNPQPDPKAEEGGVMFDAAMGLCRVRASRGRNAASSGKLNLYPYPCPYGVPGDRLWVRETWQQFSVTHDGQRHTLGYPNEKAPVVYAADCPDGEHPPRWRSSIHMPRWASRITLEITGVRVERLQEIGDEDAKAEGLPVQMGDGSGPGAGFKWNGPGYWDCVSCNEFGLTYHFPRDGFCPCKSCEGKLTPAIGAYKILWDSINGKSHPWANNPWVWCISFTRIEVSDDE